VPLYAVKRHKQEKLLNFFKYFLKASRKNFNFFVVFMCKIVKANE